MALDPTAQAALALHRFGLGPRAGSIAAISSDPRGALIAELEKPGAGRIAAADLLASGEATRAAVRFQQAQREMRRAARTASDAGKDAAKKDAPPNPEGAAPATPNASDQNTPPARPTVGTAPQQLYLDEAKARLATALDAEIGFAERLAWFWSNHFCVSADKAGVRPIAGAYEREAVRAHVLGRFADMLQAVESHPAMLIYLDNGRSVGPNSQAGKNRGRGLNENLAREILELHTLGVRSVYTQDDVTSFAKVITGWTILPARQDPVHGGEFTFNPRMHEPGTQKVVGESYADAGLDQGRRVLTALARHPATAKHIARKFARHFIADDPPLALVERLTKRFLDTQGDLKEMAKALVAAPEAWAEPRGKLKRPGEWIVGALRAIGVKPADIRPVIQAQNLLGEPLWRPPAPNGFADDDATWLDGLSQRLDVANQIARRIAGTADPKAIFDEVLAPIASAETKATITRAESRPQALALLLMAPEFQRR
ncbi:MAG: hypothetical protein QOI12_3417 [Alphaproteobacteria bacterium]|jgi:uncharacterized protein (DUF1800 family)|nr:hypothetical protein [Alphaproteobacteria bacterium]